MTSEEACREGFFTDREIWILKATEQLEQVLFEHECGQIDFDVRKNNRIEYKIWCLDEGDHNKWKCVAHGFVKNPKHLRQLRRIRHLEQAIFA